MSLLEAARAGDLAAVQQLLAAEDTDVNAANEIGSTALHQACLVGHVAIVKALLDAGASLDGCDAEDASVLLYAAHSGSLELIDLLVRRGANVHLKMKNGTTALTVLALLGDPVAVQRLLDYGANIEDASNELGWPLLLSATQSNDVATVEVLLSHGSDMHSRGKDGRSAIHVAAGNETTEMLQYLLQRLRDERRADDGVDERLTTRHEGGETDAETEGVDHRSCIGVNTQTTTGETALHEAASIGNHRAIQYLLEDGASVDLLNENGWSPLFTAAHFNHLKSVQLLVAHGADLGRVSQAGCNVLHEAAASGSMDVVEYLVGRACPNVDCVVSGVHGNAIVLDAATLDLEARTPNGCTALFEAARAGHSEVVQCLLEHGAVVDNSAVDGWTPLQIATQIGHVRTIELLLAAGADLHIHNMRGCTALMEASLQGKREAVRCLLDHGADVHTAADLRLMPAHAATLSGDKETLELLVAHGADPQSLTEAGDLALAIAAFKGQDDLIDYLVHQAVDVDAVDDACMTPFLHSIERCSIRTLELLIEHGANINIVASDGTSALSRAAEVGRKDVEAFLRRKQSGKEETS